MYPYIISRYAEYYMPYLLAKFGRNKISWSACLFEFINILVQMHIVRSVEIHGFDFSSTILFVFHTFIIKVHILLNNRLDFEQKML